jgi:hypothetical protein
MSPGAVTQSIYYARNIAAAGAGANAVKVTFNAPARFPDVRVVEYSGLDRLSPVDTTAAAAGYGTMADSGAATLSNAHDLLFAANTVSSWTTGPGSSFTLRILTSPDADIVQDRVVTAAGAYNATAPMATGAWVMQMVAFRAAP